MSTHSPALPSRPSADEVLAALDPEQREVAASPLGPMCVDIAAILSDHPDGGDHQPHRSRP